MSHPEGSAESSGQSRASEALGDASPDPASPTAPEGPSRDIAERLERIEAGDLEGRAESYGALHDDLLARLESADAAGEA